MIRKFVPFVILVLSVSLIVAGIFRQEAECVIEKATKICMECIGIG
ncbi:CD1871A family CXXC motif-containing protein [Treponema sp.]|nr:CD1871A family CXXC motif-containing protein [Treponema sp.]